MARFVCDENISIKHADAVRKSLLSLIEKGDVIVDFTNVRRIDCSIAQILIGAMKEGKKRGVSIKVAGLSDYIRSQFEICGIIRKGAKV